MLKEVENYLEGEKQMKSFQIYFSGEKVSGKRKLGKQCRGGEGSGYFDRTPSRKK